MFSLLHCSLVLPIPPMALHRSMFLTIVQVNCLFFRHAFYSSPTGFRLGGVFQNLGRLPFSHIFPESKIFSGKCWRRRGGGRRYFFENFQRRNPSFLKKFSIPACQGPLPASWAPLFTFFGGCYTPPHPPPQVAWPWGVPTAHNLHTVHRPWDTQNRKCKITCSTF